MSLKEFTVDVRARIGPGGTYTALDLDRALRIIEVLMESIRQSISRSDDFGDSYCSQPIRKALETADQIAQGTEPEEAK